jgi:signal transduction histidine kinase
MTVTVAATGIGIDAKVLPRDLPRFFTSKKRRGLGSGLPICDRMVKSHSVRIKLPNEHGVEHHKTVTLFSIDLGYFTKWQSRDACLQDCFASLPR